MSEVKRPLEGVKVVELATFIAAPCCARFLADLGAEVIKKACEAADLPLTLVEVDRQMVRFEQVRTNLETFRDLLKM